MRYSMLAAVCRMGQTLLEAAQYLQNAPQNAPRAELLQNGRQMLLQMRTVLTRHRQSLRSKQPLAALNEIETLWQGGGPELLPALSAFLQQLPQQVNYQVRAVFFAELGEKWDAMQTVYETMRADDRFDPVVVRTPVFRVTQQDGEQKQEVLYKDFLTPMGIPALGYNEYDPAADCPELALISQPFEGATLPQFWPWNIAKYTRLVYLPYFLQDQLHQNSLSALTQLPVYSAAWKAVCSGQKHYDYYCRHAANKGANALVTGLPKTDPFVRLGQNPQSCPLPKGWEVLQGKTVFLWNSWYDIEFSSLRYFGEILEWFCAHKDCALIWRRHPMSDTVTKLYYPERYPFYQGMLRRARQTENILLDEEPSCLAAFAASHAMLSDYSSLQPQYLPLNKPVLWIKGEGFEFTGEQFVDPGWMEQADSAGGILAFLERIRAGEDRNAPLRATVLKRDLPLADGHCGERVCEALWQALHQEDGVTMAEKQPG